MYNDGRLGLLYSRKQHIFHQLKINLKKYNKDEVIAVNASSNTEKQENASYLAISYAVPLIKSVAHLGETWQINFQLGWNVYQP